MKSVFFPLQVLLLSWLLTVSPARGQPSLTGPTPGILALRNGQVISGKVLRDGDRYVVTLGESAIVRIPVTSVEFYGDNLRQVYRLKKASLVADDIGEQLRLVQWCIRHGLLVEAERLMEQTVPQRNLPQWSDLQRRLTMAKRPTVATSTRQAKPSAAAPQPDPEQILEHISRHTLQEFTSFVQPLLLNRCSTTTCHGAHSKNVLKLIKPSRGRAIPTRYTQRNLYNTWQTLDTQKPDQSPLLNITTAPHGGTAALFTQREWGQYQRLVNWVRRATSNTPRPMPRGIKQPATVLAQPSPAARTTATDSATATQEAALQQAAKVEATLKAPGLPVSQKEQLPSAKAPKALPGITDPFDPALFNRRFHPDRFREPDQPTAPPMESARPAASTTDKPVSTVNGG
jgi:hypothetical protein